MKLQKKVQKTKLNRKTEGSQKKYISQTSTKNNIKTEGKTSIDLTQKHKCKTKQKKVETVNGRL